MLRQKDLIHKKDWDVLIILDACRYDIFSDVYKKVFGDIGRLYKVKTESNWTFGWFVDTFYNMPKMNDVTFISASPSVNSDNVKIYDRKKESIYGNIKFNAKEYFKKVIDISQTKFDKEYGFVFPEDVTDTIINNIKVNGKMMCKYFQVHDPYLYYINKGVVEKKNISDFNMLDKEMSKGYRVKKIISFFMSDIVFWKFRKLIGKPPIYGMGSLWIKYGTKGIRKAYTEDMKYVLRDLKRIVSELENKRVVITSDHGESLGEKGCFGHGNKMTEEIVNVPWLIIDT